MSFVKASIKWRRSAVAGATALAAACIANAAHQTSGSALSLSNTQGIAFGAFAAGAGGSVVISPSGARSATGNVMLVSSNLGAAAQFTVTGDPDFTYSITLPADGTVVLSAGAGHDMTISNFTSSPALAGQLSIAGTQQLSVGATLSVGANQPAGNYTGSLPVTVNYD